MLTSRQKSALLLLAVFGLSITCAILNGCDEKSGEATSKAVKEFQRELTADDRAAIQVVGKKLSKATDRMNSDPQSWEEFRETFKQLYETTLDADVSSCPADFRAQYDRAVASIGAFNNVLDEVPVDDGDQLAYFLAQLGSSNPDFEGKGVLHRIQVARQDMYHQISELKAVAHKYDADQEF